MVIKDTIIIIIVALFWLLSTVVGDFIGASWTATICAVTWLLFDHCIWKTLPPIIVRRYNIGGAWSGKLHYNYKNKKGAKAAELCISQTFSKTTVCLKTGEMEGESVVSQWSFSKNKLFYIYMTDPKSEYKDKNPIQYGGARIKIDPKNLNKIYIEYWTDRGTKGHMEFKKKC